eukprot:6233767-Amphidinium_carterae.1
MVHGRLRYSDAMRLMGPYDIDADTSGNPVFLEVEAEWVKMGYLKRHRRAPLPVVAFACGISGRCWAQEWLVLRRNLGVHEQD